jgi:hypothetical protein
MVLNLSDRTEAVSFWFHYQRQPKNFRSSSPLIFHYPIGESKGVWVMEQSRLLRMGRFKASDALNNRQLYEYNETPGC